MPMIASTTAMTQRTVAFMVDLYPAIARPTPAGKQMFAPQTEKGANT